MEWLAVVTLIFASILEHTACKFRKELDVKLKKAHTPLSLAKLKANMWSLAVGGWVTAMSLCFNYPFVSAILVGSGVALVLIVLIHDIFTFNEQHRYIAAVLAKTYRNPKALKHKVLSNLLHDYMCHKLLSQTALLAALWAAVICGAEFLTEYTTAQQRLTFASILLAIPLIGVIEGYKTLFVKSAYDGIVILNSHKE